MPNSSPLLRNQDTPERQCAKEAARVIREAGGTVTYDAYDRAAGQATFFAPLSWCQGWGDPALLRHNTAALAVKHAVNLGLVEQIPGGYRVMP